jgi:hypothetical protein
MTENQKKMLFCIKGLRNRDKKLIEQNPEAWPLAEELLKYFFEEIGDPHGMYELSKNRTGVKVGE